MVTTPPESRLARGRGTSPIRTPQLIRDYLSGAGEFREDSPEERAARPVQGDYIARMHQRIKLFIRSQDPAYQYPRRHSFGALVNNLKLLGLLEETGERADPEERGAGQLGTDRGFKQRSYVRLTPGSVQRREWADPIGFLALIYPNVRPTERALPEAAPPAAAPPRARRPSRAPAPAPTADLEQMERLRQAIVTDATTLAGSGNTVEEFQELLERATSLVNEAAGALSPNPFPDGFEALILLENCIRALEPESEPTARRTSLVNNCRNSARLLAEALTRPLMEAPAAPATAALPEFDLPTSPTRDNVATLVRHLQLLQQLGIERGDVQGRVAELEQDLADWEFQVEEAVAREEARDQPRPDRLDALRRIQSAIENARGFLDVRLLPRAIEALGRAYPPVVAVARAPEPEPEQVPPEPAPAAELPEFDLPATPTPRGISLLAEHLQLLERLGPDRRDVTLRIANLAQDLGDWEFRIFQAISNEEARAQPRPSTLETLRRRRAAVENAQTSLMEDNLRGAIEALGPPTAEPEVTPAEPSPAPEEAQVEERPEVPTISLPGRFSTRSIPRLLEHLQRLAELAEEQDWPGEEEPESAWPEMHAEVNRLMEAGTDWRDAAQESLDNEEARDTPREDRLESLQERVQNLESYVSALDEQDLTAAVEALESIE